MTPEGLMGDARLAPCPPPLFGLSTGLGYACVLLRGPAGAAGPSGHDVEIVIGDLDDARSSAPTLTGVQDVWLLTRNAHVPTRTA